MGICESKPGSPEPQALPREVPTASTGSDPGTCTREHSVPVCIHETAGVPTYDSPADSVTSTILPWDSVKAAVAEILEKAQATASESHDPGAESNPDGAAGDVEPGRDETNSPPDKSSSAPARPRAREQTKRPHQMPPVNFGRFLRATFNGTESDKGYIFNFYKRYRKEKPNITTVVQHAAHILRHMYEVQENEEKTHNICEYFWMFNYYYKIFKAFDFLKKTFKPLRNNEFYIGFSNFAKKVKASIHAEYEIHRLIQIFAKTANEPSVSFVKRHALKVKEWNNLHAGLEWKSLSHFFECIATDKVLQEELRMLGYNNVVEYLVAKKSVAKLVSECKSFLKGDYDDVTIFHVEYYSIDDSMVEWTDFLDFQTPDKSDKMEPLGMPVHVSQGKNSQDEELFRFPELEKKFEEFKAKYRHDDDEAYKASFKIVETLYQKLLYSPHAAYSEEQIKQDMQAYHDHFEFIKHIHEKPLPKFPYLDRRVDANFRYRPNPEFFLGKNKEFLQLQPGDDDRRREQIKRQDEILRKLKEREVKRLAEKEAAANRLACDMDDILDYRRPIPDGVPSTILELSEATQSTSENQIKKRRLIARTPQLWVMIPPILILCFLVYRLVVVLRSSKGGADPRRDSKSRDPFSMV